VENATVADACEVTVFLHEAHKITGELLRVKEMWIPKWTDVSKHHRGWRKKILTAEITKNIKKAFVVAEILAYFR
jgi:hypothetical protein